MRQIRKILRDKRGEGYIDVASMVQETERNNEKEMTRRRRNESAKADWLNEFLTTPLNPNEGVCWDQLISRKHRARCSHAADSQESVLAGESRA